METFDKKIQERYTNPSKYYHRIANDPLNMEYQRQRAEMTGDYSEIENIHKYQRHGFNNISLKWLLRVASIVTGLFFLLWLGTLFMILPGV